MMLIFIVIWSLWFISEIVLNIFFRSNREDIKGVDKNSLRIIWITIGIANLAAILFAKIDLFPIGKTLIISYIGLFLIITGMIIRFTAIYTLGRFFTVDLTIKENHKIKMDGLYKFIRHPAYSGALLSFLGFGLSLNDYTSLVVITIPVTLAFINRIRIEEKLLIDQFGKEYIEYMKRTYCLIPFIY
jgi:protein-S-isoprenylcysteine O-methyltransferase Ste14